MTSAMHRFRRSYTGPVRGALFDWAGTTVDFGSRAPARVFCEVFRRSGVEITVDEARGPMGMQKKDHLRLLTQMPAVAQRWRDTHGSPPTEKDVEELFEQFIPLQIACLADFADPVPGCPEMLAALRQRGLRIGSNTGYTHDMMEVLVPAARQRGFDPESIVCSSDVPCGRPAPWMCLKNAEQLGVYPLEALVKVDDTAPGIEEGLNAGMWTVAVARTGNEMGLSLEEIERLPRPEYDRRLEAAYRRLAQAGAHFVIDGVDQLLPCVDDIERRLARGEKP
jgi:phosphonoacetaldehyde hydrolase